jgi:hypothetical protein
MDVEVRHGETTELHHRLAPAGTLAAVVPPFKSLGLRRAGENRIHVSFISPRGGGAVTIPGLAAGAWEICSLHSDPRYRPLVLATFEIRPGETTFLDVLERGRATAEITFRDRGVPVAGVKVRIVGSPGTLLSDADGRVAVRLSMWDRYSLSVRFRFPGADALWVHRLLHLGEPGGTWVWRYDIDAPTARVTFRATDPGHGPVEGVRVSLHVGPTAPGQSVDRAELSRRDTGPAGEITWPALPEGGYGWEAVFPNGTIRSGKFELGPGESREIEVAAEAVTSLRARIVDARGEPAKGARVTVQIFRPGREEGEHRSVKAAADDDGVIVVPGLPESRVHVQAFRGSWEPWKPDGVERAPPADVEIRPPAEAAVTLTLSER